jgi:4-hydroxybenzoate polyprenyltransferase
MLASLKAYTRQHWAVGLLMATHPFPAAMNGVAGFLIFMIADHTASYYRAVLLLAAICLVHASIGAMNDYVDEAGDRLSNPNKPLVRGLISRSQVLVLSLLCGSLGVALAFASDSGASIAVLVLAAGMAYNFGLKGTWLSWLPYAIFIPSVAVWAFLAAGATSPLLLLSYPLGTTIAVALNLANTLPDLEGDAKLGLSGLAHQLGKRGSRRMIVLLFVAAGAMVAGINVWARLPAMSLAALTIGLGAGILLGKLFAGKSRATLRVGWYATAIAAVLLGSCWAVTLNHMLGLDTHQR